MGIIPLAQDYLAGTYHTQAMALIVREWPWH
jgi:hypothetical protein